jgi:ribosomal protein L11 methyltransferase
MARHAAQGGYLILSGLLLEQAEDVTAAYFAAGFERVHASEHGEWAALTLRYLG